MSTNQQIDTLESKDLSTSEEYEEYLDIFDKFKELNEKCDIIIKKIKNRKEKTKH